MFCKKCGAPLPENATDCPQCRESSKASGGTSAEIQSHLVGAILVTLFCCLPLGIVSIVYAARVSGLVAAGDMAAAKEASEKASKWMWLAFWLGLAAIVLSALFNVVAALFAGGR